MSYNNAIPLDILLALASAKGVMHQLKLPLYDPEFFIKEEFLTDVMVTYSWAYDTGDTGSTLSSVGHPSFEALRESLGQQGYIQIQRNWSNGDRVIKPFLLNGQTFEEGETFYSPGALSSTLKTKRKNNDISR